MTIKIYQKLSAVNSKGGAPLYIRFYISREKIDIPTGITIEAGILLPDGTIPRSVEGYRDKNLIIESIRSRISEIAVRFRLQGRKLTKEAFKRTFRNNTGYENFTVFALERIRKCNETEFSTKKAHMSVIGKLTAYSPDLQFDEIDDRFFKEYCSYLKRELNNSEATVMRNLSVLKKYIRMAVRESLIVTDPFGKIKIKSPKPKIVYLTESELENFLREYERRTFSDTEHAVLEFFLFMCFTSLHISDAKALRIEQIEADKFVYFRKKNRNSKPEPILIPLSDPAKRIIEKVRDGRNKGILFDSLVSDVRINVFLKRIAAQVGFDKNLSTKAGRHTFATVYLRRTKDLASLKELLGHSQIRETLIYAHVLEDAKMDYIRCFNSF